MKKSQIIQCQSVCVHSHVLLLSLEEDRETSENYTWYLGYSEALPSFLFFLQETSHMERALHPEHTAQIIISAD